MASDQDRVGRMSRRNVFRTQLVVEAVESSPFRLASASRGAPPTMGLARAKVTTAIPAGTFASPSDSGRAQIYRRSGTSWDVFGDPVTVYNDHSFCSGTTSIAVDKVVKLGWIAGQWWLVGADN